MRSVSASASRQRARFSTFQDTSRNGPAGTNVHYHMRKLHVASGCGGCGSGKDLGFDFTMALQPIVNMTTRQVVAQEALVRGLEQQGAAAVLEQVTDDNRYLFDQMCRIKAVQLGARLAAVSEPAVNGFRDLSFLSGTVLPGDGDGQAADGRGADQLAHHRGTCADLIGIERGAAGRDAAAATAAKRAAAGEDQGQGEQKGRAHPLRIAR